MGAMVISIATIASIMIACGAMIGFQMGRESGEQRVIDAVLAAARGNDVLQIEDKLYQVRIVRIRGQR